MAADWWSRTQLLLGSEKETGRTLLGTDCASGPLLVLVLEMAALGEVMVFLALLVTEPLVLVSVAVVGMLLGVMGLFK